MNGKRDGFFVELGASNGVIFSNTLFFEREKNWKGICIEPHDGFYRELVTNRSCHTCNDLVSDIAGKTVPFVIKGHLSGIDDENKGEGTQSTEIVEKTTSTLEQVLDRFEAPSIIDYLSLDVEGHEYTILSTFPFDKYKFRCMTVEHNGHQPQGRRLQILIRTLLESKGYVFIKSNDDIHGWGH